MQNTRRFMTLALTLAAFSGLCAFTPARAADGKFTDAQKSEINQVIKDFMKDNPEVVFQSLQLYQQKKTEEMQKNAQGSIVENREALVGKDLPSAGNPDGDVTVTEFFDYNCGYCKHAIDDIQKILESDKKVRFVFKELPILGPTSEVAARWAIAAHKQGKYFEFHQRMMHNTGQIDEAVLEKVSADAGLNVDQMKKDVESDDVKQTVSKSRELALKLQIQGTPGFIIGDKVYRGYMGPDGLKNAIDEAHKGK